VLESVLGAAEALAERGAVPLVIGERPDAALRLPGGLPEWLTPLAAVVPGQVLALRWAQVGGHPIDAPPGLRKVTVTR
jgi:glucosamine--fructose-6-phosphate aminotransferase (isomerizing)